MTEERHRQTLAEMHEDHEDHPNTVVVLEREGLTAWYTLDDVDSMGFHLSRYVDGEKTHEECLTWNEAARMIRSQTMRVYDMTDEEVENLG